MSTASTQTSQAILQTKGLVKRFGGLLATDHVSLDLHVGELHALIGPNGAGKTTLISQITGELAPDEGDVLINGQGVNRLAVHERTRLGLARSYQITQIMPDFTALENVAMAVLAQDNLHKGRKGYGAWQALHHQSDLMSRAHAALAQAQLSGQANTPASVMAHGEHRQLEIAMALALQPKFLLLDEPLAGMSSSESEVIIQLLKTLKNSYPILMIEHDMHAVFSLADRISVLVYGKVIATGTPEQIKTDPEVKIAYLGDESLVA